jgi:hypothetical protein
MAADGPDSTEIPWDCYHWKRFARGTIFRSGADIQQSTIGTRI